MGTLPVIRSFGDKLLIKNIGD